MYPVVVIYRNKKSVKLTTCMPVLKLANPHVRLHVVPCEVVSKSLVLYSTACLNKHHHRKMVPKCSTILANLLHDSFIHLWFPATTYKTE